MHMIRFHDPRAASAVEAEPYGLAVDLAGRNAAPVAFLANGFPDSEAFLDAVAEAMTEAVPGLDARRWNKGNASIPAPASMLAEIERDCVAVVAAYGH
jgi:hypothetical protein